MTDRRLLMFVVMMLAAENFGEAAADWWHTAEVNRPPDEHGRFLTEGPELG